MEQALQNESACNVAEHLNTLNTIKRELEKALREFKPLLEEAESKKPDAVQTGVEELTALFAELRPLLEKGDFGATGYAEKLRGIEGMEELAARIDDYDFEDALKILNSLE